MNRPTIDVDELLLLADEAIAAGDGQAAIEMLRRASSIAPLRKDIRNRLAVALEGSPVPAARRSQAIAEPEGQDWDPSYADNEDSQRESIGIIARKAFQAATDQKNKATEATRRLTSLLHHGIENWKTTWTTPESRDDTPAQGDTGIGLSQSQVFEPYDDLEDYLNRTAEDQVVARSTPLFIDEDPAADPVENAPTTRISKPATISKKASRNSQRKGSRPTDVEDVLAAGIDGFLSAASRIDKRRLVFAGVYAAMLALLGVACFDVSRKFPGQGASTGLAAGAATASLGGFETRIDTAGKSETLDSARQLAREGRLSEAVDSLRRQVNSENILVDHEQVRIELAALLNQAGEKQLMESKFEESVKSYREASSYRPDDQKLKVRLANALYYQSIMGNLDATRKGDILEESSRILEQATAGEGIDLQANRLMALVYEQRNMPDKAKAMWKKVKTQAPAKSDILSEAESRLK